MKKIAIKFLGERMENIIIKEGDSIKGFIIYMALSMCASLDGWYILSVVSMIVVSILSGIFRSISKPRSIYANY